MTTAEPINTADPSGSETTTEEPLNPKSKLWKKIKVEDWKNSVLNEDSVFAELYQDTRRRIVEAAKGGQYDVIVEVGCGTGEVISHLGDAGIPRIGLDINESFVQHCQAAYADQKGELSFYVCDATKLDVWWKEKGLDEQYQAPLMVCPNNTITVMAEGIREELLKKMRLVAGTKGRCVITFWNGRLFAHGVMGYYKKNGNLCGDFGLDEVNWEGRSIETKTQYKSAWLTAEDIVRWMNSLWIDVELGPAQNKATLPTNHVAEYGIGVYLWLQGEDAAAYAARDYYDSPDSQTFYSTVWGKHTHIGRYDLISKAEKESLSLQETIRRAQELHQQSMMETIAKRYDGSPVRCLDMGCGYGGLLRALADRDMLWSGVGVDISSRMIARCRELAAHESEDDVLTFRRENYMNTSVPNEAIDLVISMDAFDHVGAGQHKNVLQEAWRVLRPGGRLIFTDIMMRDDAAPQAKDLRQRMNLQAFGTVAEYERLAVDECGFGEFSFQDFSDNISKHYGTVHDVLLDLWNRQAIDVSEDFKNKQVEGLEKWRDLAPSCLQWGIVSMRKVATRKKSQKRKAPLRNDTAAEDPQKKRQQREQTSA